MKVLLDTNIVIHREASRIINQDIGQLFRWLDRISTEKCIHPITVQEINKYRDSETVATMSVKLDSYYVLRTEAPQGEKIQELSRLFDNNENDSNDTKLLNELYSERVDLLITEDRKLHKKAEWLGISEMVHTIDTFIAKSISDNPSLIDYEVLSVQKKHFGNINIHDLFFDSFRSDYEGFDSWFNNKSDELAYICNYRDEIRAFLYIKVEDEKEDYSDISPAFTPKKRLKIGTLKVTLNGLKIGERFLKIIFDHALHFNVEEIYVTIFDKRPEQKRLMNLFEDFGFKIHGSKNSKNGEEIVYVRDFTSKSDLESPRITFPFLSPNSNVYFVSIYPEYHTELFPDSILKTEVAQEFIDNQPHRNAISKVYISHAFERPIKRGDIIIFYRTGGYYKGVVTTLCIVENIHTPVQSLDELKLLCKKKTVLSESELSAFWNKFPRLKPFVIDILYSYTLKNKINLKRLVEMGIIASPQDMPRGFGLLSQEDLLKILRESNSNESIISH